jgi:RHS repeat-associated protein
MVGTFESTLFRRTAVAVSFASALALGLQVNASGSEPNGGPAGSPPIPNRTLSNVEPPRTGLEFSANPTPQELFRARVFEEPLVPVGGEPSPAENAALAVALLGYAQRRGPDDFSSLTGFLDQYPKSLWCASLLTDLGIEYYNTAHYSLAIDAWEKAWAFAKNATDSKGKAIGDRAAGELAYMYARLGRMAELQALLKSVEGRTFVGPATERITGAREGLWSMQHRPEISFRCGPLALQRIRLSLDPQAPLPPEIFNSASTQKGFSLVQVAELAKRIGLNYQMAFREKAHEFVVPSVVHWKVGHYAALVRQEGDRYLLEDPTFGNTVWATRQALEEETSGYFLVPSGKLPAGWRAVETKEGDTIWGKGIGGANDPHFGPCDPSSGGGSPCEQSEACCKGMAVSSVLLMPVNLHLKDRPVGYSPPVGPPLYFTVRYNHRDAFQPGTFTYANFGPKWTSDWISYINDNPSNGLADVTYYVRGGGGRVFTGFDTNSQTYSFQQYDQTQLKRTGSASYEMTWPTGAKLVFSQPDGAIGTSRKVFLTQVVDPRGNAVTLTYDGNLRLTTITDAVGQATTVSYGATNDIYKITKVTDPFGRFATFNYDSLGRLTNITDVIGIPSQFAYETNSDFVTSLTTPYGTTTFIRGDTGNTRRLDTVYPDGSRDRVEFNQDSGVGIPNSDSAASVPVGMSTANTFLYARNTYFWDRNAYAAANGDYTKARIYHWLHTADLVSTAGIVESSKPPLEGRVWYDYANQISALQAGSSSRPLHAGRVLDDGSTQLYTYAYNGFGHVTNMVDPIGRTYSFVYAPNGIDLLEVRMTRLQKNDLLSSWTYNSQHLPTTITDAAGQTNYYTYNSRGQLTMWTNPKNQTMAYSYDTNGYLVAVHGPLPGTNDVATFGYDSFGRFRTITDVNGYTLTYDYDALDRVTAVTFPDSTSRQYTYSNLDAVLISDRAGRGTSIAYDPLRRIAKVIDPLGRTNLFDWCSCGRIKSLTDALGRTTSWETDVQGRLTGKTYADGSRIAFSYENTTSRLRQLTDEKLQVRQFSYNLDNTLRSIGYGNCAVPTPAVSYFYDPSYPRLVSMTDGIGTTTYSYNPIGSLGALELAAATGPWPSDSVTYLYDELGWETNRTINGVSRGWVRDPLGRVTNSVNALGSFAYSYDGASRRITDISFPNGQTSHFDYYGNVGDRRLEQITHRRADTSILSQFTYAYDVIGNVTNWVQQLGSYTETWAAGYDLVNRLTSFVVNQGGTNVMPTSYSYDAAENRLVEDVNGVPTKSHFNALNQLASIPTASPTNTAYEWDGGHRLTAIVRANNRSEFAYDGHGRLRQVTEKVSGTITSQYRFTWCGTRICEERDANNTVVARFFGAGEQQGGTNLYYCSDHLGSVRELTDAGGGLRAEYAYTPFGIKARRQGDLESAFGFTRLLNHKPSATLFAVHRVYDPRAARWLSRDPIGERGGLNLYGYVLQNPINRVDPGGLAIVEYFDRPMLQDTNQCDMAQMDNIDPEIQEISEAEKRNEEYNEMVDEQHQEFEEYMKNILGGTGWAADTGEVLLHIHALGKFGGVLDILESGIDVTIAIEHPTAKNIGKATVSCGETVLLIAAPEIGVPIKIVLWVDEVLPAPPPDWYDEVKRAPYVYHHFE